MCETFNRLSRVQVQSELCTQVPDMQTCPSKLRALQRRALFSRNYHCRQLVRCFFQALRFGHFIPPTHVHGFHSHTHTHTRYKTARLNSRRQCAVKRSQHQHRAVRGRLDEGGWGCLHIATHSTHNLQPNREPPNVNRANQRASGRATVRVPTDRRTLKRACDARARALSQRIYKGKFDDSRA